jgi:sigma-B regulation protein RsbU (phosphoserine phosphatase)
VRALIADDDRLSALMVARAVERLGQDVVIAADGVEAWAVLQSERSAHLAIIDWEMPGITGPELCRRLRADERLSHVYVLLLTTRDTRTDLVAGLDAGADDYITKPFDPEEFRARVHVGLRVLGLQQRLAERIKDLESASSKIDHLQGLLPICSYCRHVRSDQDYWEQVEDYVAHHSGLQFSHGICPRCYDAALKQIEER